MLSMSELAMNPNRKVTTVCYGKKQEWDDREEAQAYFLEAMKMMTRRTSHEAL